VGVVDQEDAVSPAVEVNRVGVVAAEVVGVANHVDAANRGDAVNRVVEANHVVVVELEASHVTVEANPEDDVIQALILIIIVEDLNQECEDDHLQHHLDGNQTDHVTLVDLEVKIEGKSICPLNFHRARLN